MNTSQEDLSHGQSSFCPVLKDFTQGLGFPFLLAVEA